MCSGEENEAPHYHHIDQGDEDCGAADVLGTLGQVMVIEGNAVHGGLEGRIDELDDDHQQHAGNHQGLAEGADGQEQGQGDEHRRQPGLLAEGVLVAVGGGQAGHGIVEGVPHPGQTGLAFEGAFLHGGDGPEKR